ncbi:O-antigen ligase domain-containing protein [Oceanobacillus piezotolerans]|uniref:O-antigen ligase domain-containing protein n=1 Tax=Oceanobacillus piezotolerans TaxID=2448030 RepID=A0A498DEA1_9BACI|nr:O-antigen ligase family protein [Oceanobacillus piezotolerans]RLL46990.1 O-antigen ligase domain-containing protein [Oceanobacillus piezotolerans]
MSLHETYYRLLILFAVVYPFLIFPFGTVYYTTVNKLVFLIVFVSVGWIIYMKKCNHSQVPPKILLESTGGKLAFLFFGLVFLSTIFSMDVASSFIGSPREYNGLLSWYGFLSMFIFTYHIIKSNQKYAVRIITAIVWSATIISVYSILQQLNLHERMPFQKSWGLFDNPNHLGTYLVIMVLLAFTLLLMAGNKASITVYLGIILVLFLALFYSGSRGAWLSVAICMVLYTIVVWPKKYLWKRWGVILASMLIAFSIVNVVEGGVISNRIESITLDIKSIITEDVTNQEAEDAGSGRWGIWKKTLPFVKENILVGTGPSTFSQLYYSGEEAGGLDNSHNDYLEIAFSMGIPALIVYMMLLFTVIKKGYRAAGKSDDSGQIFIYGLLITVIGYLIKTNFNISTIAVGPYFWVVLAVLYGYAGRESFVSPESGKNV